MSTATPQHGSKAHFSIGGTDIQDHLQGTIGIETDYAVVDSTVFGAAATTHITSPIADNKAITINLICDAAELTLLTGLVGVDGTAGVYSPFGTTTGNPKQSGVGSLSNLQVKSDMSGLTAATVTFTPSGAWPWGTY